MTHHHAHNKKVVKLQTKTLKSPYLRTPRSSTDQQIHYDSLMNSVVIYVVFISSFLNRWIFTLRFVTSLILILFLMISHSIKYSVGDFQMCAFRGPSVQTEETRSGRHIFV